MSKNLTPEQWWHGLLTGVNPALPARQLRNLFRLIPNGPRCKFCNAPYHGIGGALFHMIGKGPSSLTPQLCRQCYGLTSQYLGGTEIELTMLFADVRGSTPLAESMSPLAYSKLISRFFGVASEVFIRSEALLNRLVGDQVIGLYVPGFAGADHRYKAIRAAQDLLYQTGHMNLDGPWLPIGVGIHTGVAFLGSVGSNENATDIAVLGDPPNIAARLSSSAAAGEILISEDAFAPDMNLERMEKRQLALKGKSKEVNVYVMKAFSPT
ncbi:MAG TPA: adenylate/guanylate cyclase domain-containing protein [Anaerolineales bacterium]|nr:adenylate/guanylate cyclase domain-containing protein [Anaerolineales bacterium]